MNKRVTFLLNSEGGQMIVTLSKADAAKVKKLLKRAMKERDGEVKGPGEWPDEVNTILDRAKVVRAQTIDTTGDNWGLYDCDDLVFGG